jgi:Histone deacetylase domain
MSTLHGISIVTDQVTSFFLISNHPDDRIGDPEYLAAFHYLIMPIATEFNPDLVRPFSRRNNVQVLVSAGFDAAEGHSNGLGGLRVTPGGYAMMTKLVTQLAQGRVILALEGGYELAPLANSATACLEQLLSASRPSPPPIEGMLRTLKPCTTAQENLARVWGALRDYWQCLKEGPSPLDKGWVLPREWKRERGNGVENNVGTPVVEKRKRRLISEGY